MNRLCSLVLISAVFISWAAAFGETEAVIDNRHIQQYRGYTGAWVKADYARKTFIQKVGADESAVAKINGGFPKKGHVFVPFSDEYLQALEDSGTARKTVVSADTEFIWPVDSPDRISSPFGYRNLRLHAGVDLPVITNSPIVAAMDGTVESCGYYGGHGKTILLKHSNGFYTRYSHNSDLLVKKGDSVKKGQMIAFSGNTGHSTGPHLHFEIRYKDIPLNPLDFLPQDDDLVITKNKNTKKQKRHGKK